MLHHLVLGKIILNVFGSVREYSIRYSLSQLPCKAQIRWMDALPQETINEWDLMYMS